MCVFCAVVCTKCDMHTQPESILYLPIFISLPIDACLQHAVSALTYHEICGKSLIFTINYSNRTS